MKMFYQKPEVEMISLKVEGFFAASPNSPSNDDDVSLDDGGEALDDLW